MAGSYSNDGISIRIYLMKE